MSNVIVNASTKINSRTYFKNKHPFGGKPQSALALAVSSASSGVGGSARMVVGNQIRVSVSCASDATVIAKFPAPFKLELTDWAIITKLAGSGPTVTLARAGDNIAALRPVSVASYVRQALTGSAAYWDIGNTVVESGSYVRLSYTQSHVHSAIHVLSYRPMA
jgi:hypothetical protein